MDLPAAADAMYKTWWSFAQYAATTLTPEGTYAYDVATVQAAASVVNREVYGGQGGYNPIGMSQLFSLARRMGNASRDVMAAADTSPITDSMVAQAPWSRPAADMAAMPMWQARAQISYLQPDGTPATGFITVSIPQILPSSVGSLRSQMDLRVTDMLSAPEGVGTPTRGALSSIDSITLLAVLYGWRWYSPLA